MSHLRVVWPDDETAEDQFGDVGVTLAFDQAHAPRAPRFFRVVERAQRLHVNRQCPFCAHPMVRPVELDNATVNRCGQPIPGTATLVGFHCLGCQAEWSA